ncbi:MAG: hypothetical protein FJ207_12015 [Gemmatimonadetes bacterium]|nr:hypothetical protein [Gemmatimonadota bacterium]
MSENNSNNKGGRLPPPAFPPGSRRKVVRSPAPSAPQTPATPSVSEDAFISPDDPMPARADKVASAFIQPDDPIPERRPDSMKSAFIAPEDPIPKRDLLGARRTMGKPEEGVVTGIGSDAHMDKGELAAAGDPHVMELIDAVGKLAQALRRKGEAGLRSSPEMTRFDATLRAYCVGYLAGRRAEAPPDFLDWGEASKEDA